jgi:hypothetical protein
VPSARAPGGKVGRELGWGTVLRRARQVLERAGLMARYVVHDLRHTAASVLITRGTPLIEVAQILGHAWAARDGRDLRAPGGEGGADGAGNGWRRERIQA